MPTIQAFPGWRYDPAKVDYGRVAAPPYDVITPEMQTALYNRDDRNAVRLIFGRTFDTDTDQDNRYTRAAAHLGAWREEGLFAQDAPSLYPYEQSFRVGEATVVRRGFFARVLLGEWGESGIYPHEKTLSGPKVDRLDLMRAVRGNPGPVFGLLADDDGAVSAGLSSLLDEAPLCDFEDDNGVRNRMWRTDAEVARGAVLHLASERPVFIADGHHRYETALAYRNETREAMRAAGRTPPPLGELDCDYVLMLIVPDSDPGLVIWPTHRLVYGIADFSPNALLEGCAQHFTVSEAADEAALHRALEAAEAPTFGLVLPGSQHVLTLSSPAAMDARAPDKPESWRRLDVAALHLLILEDLLGIDEDKLLRKENILYSKDAGEAFRMARSGDKGSQAGFLMRATPMNQVRDVARDGEVMPQKSTYFYPKVLSGLVLHLFW